MNGTAKTVLFDFMMRCRISGGGKKRKDRVILNNGELVYPYSEAESKGIPRSTFMRAVDDLVAAGFIDIAHSGSGGKKGDCSLYAISERWRDWGTDQFKPATRPKDTRRGRGFRKGNDIWQRSRQGHERQSANMGVKNGNSTIAENGN